MDSYKNYMAVSVNLESLSVRILVMRGLLFGVYVEASDFWKLPYRELEPGQGG